MMMGIFCPLLRVVRAHNEVAAGGSIEEVCHVIAAGGHDLFATIDVFLAYGGDRRLVDQLRHRGIVDAWWAAIKDLHFTGATHGAGDAICQLANATQQLLTLFCSEGTHGTL